MHHPALRRPGLGHILRRWCGLLHILVVPPQISFIAIANITRAGDAVKLVWINYELRFHSETAQGLIHLLAALDWDVEVALPAEEQRRRLDAIGVQEGIRDLDVGLPGFRVPRWTNLVIVLNDVLIGAVKSDREGCAGAAGGAFEALIGGAHVIGENTAV